MYALGIIFVYITNFFFFLNYFQSLEQEKHVLRRKLSVAQSEGESRVLELHSDLKDLRSKLDVQEASVRQAEREKAALIEELSAQNTRLTSQLQEATQIETQLTNQLQEIRDQCSLRSTSLQVRNKNKIN